MSLLFKVGMIYLLSTISGVCASNDEGSYSDDDHRGIKRRLENSRSKQSQKKARSEEQEEVLFDYPSYETLKPEDVNVYVSGSNEHNALPKPELAYKSFPKNPGQRPTSNTHGMTKENLCSQGLAFPIQVTTYVASHMKSAIDRHNAILGAKRLFEYSNESNSNAGPAYDRLLEVSDTHGQLGLEYLYSKIEGFRGNFGRSRVYTIILSEQIDALQLAKFQQPPQVFHQPQPQQYPIGLQAPYGHQQLQPALLFQPMVAPPALSSLTRAEQLVIQLMSSQQQHRAEPRLQPAAEPDANPPLMPTKQLFIYPIKFPPLTPIPHPFPHASLYPIERSSEGQALPPEVELGIRIG